VAASSHRCGREVSLNRERPLPEFGSPDEEISRLRAVSVQTWAAAPPGSDPRQVAAEVLARQRHGARQLSDGAMLTLVAGGLLALTHDAETDPSVLEGYSGATRLLQRFRALVDDADGPETLEPRTHMAVEALEKEPPDPDTFEAIAALGLQRLGRVSSG
jgi:hypothetical protein